MPDSAKAFAEAKFKRPGVFARACPHVVDELRSYADQSREGCDVASAKSGYDAVLAKDPNDFVSKLSRAHTELKCADVAQGRSQVELLLPTLPRALADRAKEMLADALLLEGETARAAETYRALGASTADEDQGRSYDVKAYAAEHSDALVRQATIALLIGSKGHASPDLLLAGFELGKHSTHPLMRYLTMKNLAQRGYYREARALQAAGDSTPAGINEALEYSESDLPKRVQRELLRQRIVIACALGDSSELLRLRAKLTPELFVGSSGGRQLALARMIRAGLYGVAAVP
jgi:hypothetical protein